MDWPGHSKQRSTMRALSQQPQRHVHRRDAPRRPRHRDVRHGRGRRRLQQRRLPRPPHHLRGPEPPVPEHRQGHVHRRDRASGPRRPQRVFSTSALWFDYDRDGLLDLFVCNYVKWSPEHDVFCSVDGKQKSYCTPEAYRGATCWLFRNRGDGTFEDVTATSGIFDSSSKSLGVAMLDYDQRRLARPVRRQRHAAQQALSQPAQRHLQGRGAAGGRGVQRGRQGARRHGRGCGRLRQLRHPEPGRHQLRQRDAGLLPGEQGRVCTWTRRRVPRSAAARAAAWASAVSSSMPISTACWICSSSTATSTIR